jgi:aminoglycoside phosphotransferase family enzyme
MTNRFLLAPFVALVLFAAAGCGGSDSNDFVEGYNSATQPLAELTAGLSSGEPTANSLNQMADGLADVKTKLAALEPPEGAQDELDAMLASIDESTAQVRTMAKAVKSQDVEQLTQATQEFSASGTELVQAEEALRAAVEN